MSRDMTDIFQKIRGCAERWSVNTFDGWRNPTEEDPAIYESTNVATGLATWEAEQLVEKLKQEGKSASMSPTAGEFRRLWRELT